MKYTLKQAGKYYTGNNAQRGFFARGIGACYSFTLSDVEALQRIAGGEIVEVIRNGPFSYTEGATIEATTLWFPA